MWVAAANATQFSARSGRRTRGNPMTPETERQAPAHPMDEFGRAVPDPSNVREWLVLVAAAIGLYLCYRLSLPFLSALTWALVLAILLAPLHRHVERAIPKADLS